MLAMARAKLRKSALGLAQSSVSWRVLAAVAYDNMGTIGILEKKMETTTFQ